MDDELLCKFWMTAAFPEKSNQVPSILKNTEMFLLKDDMSTWTEVVAAMCLCKIQWSLIQSLGNFLAQFGHDVHHGFNGNFQQAVVLREGLCLVQKP